MSEYIELSTITPSSSEESVFNKQSTSTGIRHRGGYIAIPINSSNSSISSAGSVSKARSQHIPSVGSAVIGAGSQYQHIFETQLGAVAADPNNPITKSIDEDKNKYYATVPWELRRLKFEDRQRLVKPYNLPWNKETKSQYAQHWRLVNPRRGQRQQTPKKQQLPLNLPRENLVQHGLVLPLSNNIGPGNPIRPPTNTADLIAQGHDIHYQQAKSDTDVLSADREAISLFAHEAVQGQDPISRIHAAVGGIGLGVKHTIESISGKVLYGSPQEENTNSQQSEDGIDDFLEQVRERQETNKTDEKMSDVEMAEATSSQGSKRSGSSRSGKPAKVLKSGTSLPGTGGNLDGMTSGGSAQNGSPAILRPIGLHVDKMRKTYHKKHRFLTSANANTILKEAASTGIPKRFALTTGLASIPWEYLFMYMSPAEYNRMKQYPGTFALSAEVTVKAWNTRVAFQTGDTQTSNATLNQNKFLQVAKGIRSIPYIASNNRRYTFSSTEPMLPTGFASQPSQTYREGLKIAMYGHENDSTRFAQVPPTNATGAEIYLQDYLTIYTLDATAENDDKTYLPGFPPYKDFIEEFDASACVNGVVANMTYDFHYAPLVPNYPAVPQNKISSTSSLNLTTGTYLEISANKNVSLGQESAPIHSVNHVRKFLQGPNQSATYFTEDQVYYKLPMEQGGVFEEVHNQSFGDSQMPSLNVGIRAVPKLTTSDNTTQATSWLDAQGYFEVDCTLVTESVDPYTYIQQNCYASNTSAQLQWFTDAAATGRPKAKSYDYPNVFGRMRVVNT